MDTFLDPKSPQKVFEIGGVKVGGAPGTRPTVLVGSIFFRNHKIVVDEKKGEFDKEAAEKAIKTQEEFSDKTGNPCMLDVVGATPEALIKELDFVSGVTVCPLLMDGLSAQIRMGALKHVIEIGLTDRVIYNSISPGYQPDELESLRQSGVKNAVLLAYNMKDFTSRGRMNCIRETLPRLLEAGVENVLVDTCVLDIPSLGSACKAIVAEKNELGYPAGCGAHNAIGTWRGLKTKMGPQAARPSTAVVSALSAAFGADFILYGPLESADYVFPSVALVNTAIAQTSIEEGRRPDRTHPIYRIP